MFGDMSLLLPHAFRSTPLPLAEQAAPPLVTDPAGLLAILLAVLAMVLTLERHPAFARLFRLVPTLVFCYFIPAALTALNVIPADSPFYDWVKNYVLSAALLLLTLSLDVPGLLRLGPKPLIMMLAGACGVILGGPIALLICRSLLPADAWRLMAYLAGSWIGGGANAVALQKAFNVSNAAISPVIVVDVIIANSVVAFWLYLAARRNPIDRLMRADTSALDSLQRRLRDHEARTARIATVSDVLAILALGFGFAWVSHICGGGLFEWTRHAAPWIADNTGAFMMAVSIVTAIGIALSFTRLRNLEGAGASRFGGVMIYLMVACIGAGADFRKVAEAPAFLLLGVIWICIHLIVVLTVARLIRAPLFLAAVSSQANIGGPATAPIVAAAFDPLLAPVGVLLSILGYAIGTYGGWLCTLLCRRVVSL